MAHNSQILNRPTRRRSRIDHNLAISVAMMEQRVEQTTMQFNILADKFDRIIERMEQLTLNTTTLISRHDNQIQIIQKQLVGAEEIMRETKEAIQQTPRTLADNLSKQFTEGLGDTTKSVEALSLKTTTQHNSLDKRIRALERWRWMLMGAGIALGLFFDKAVNLIQIISTP